MTQPAATPQPEPERSQEQASVPSSHHPLADIQFLTGRSEPEWQGIAPPPPVSPNATRKERDRNAEESRRAAANRERLGSILSASLSPPNLVVLAGSGTSLGSGVNGPSMQNLFDQCAALPDFTAARERVQYPAEEASIEDLLSRCRAYQALFGGEDSGPVAGFLQGSEREITSACSTFLRTANLTAHHTFLRRLARRRSRAPRLKLFTTNYDLFFEKAAGELGIVLLDGFTFSAPRRFEPRLFGYDIVRRAQDPGANNDFVEGVIQLFKVHGSVNWDRREDGAIVQAENPARPCLVFPATTKYEQSYEQPHLELMSQFLSALREPNTQLIVVGFGFNDKHITTPLLAALSDNPSLSLLVVDRSAREKAEAPPADWNRTHRWLREQIAAGDPRITLLNADFAQFASLIPDLRALSPAEELASSVRRLVSAR